MVKKTQRTCKSEKWLLEQHGITKEVKIHLPRLKPNSIASEWNFTNPNISTSEKKQKEKPRPRCDDNPYKCLRPNCKYQNVLYYKVASHMTTTHGTERPYKCHICSKAFKFKNNLKSHLVCHSGVKKFECNFPGCDSKFCSKLGLKNHECIHTEAYKCSKCGKRFGRKYHLERHMATHEKKYFWERCDYATNRSSCLKTLIEPKRIEKTKGPRPLFNCSQCKFSTVYIFNLKRHLNIHLQDKPYSCPFCEHKCAAKWSLTCHIETHTREKPFSCSMCDFKTAIEAHVQSHFKKHHTSQVRNYTCSFCTKAFYTKVHLYSHIRTHTGEKPFSCTFCGHEFTHNGTRHTHEKCCKQRPNGVAIKPFNCQFCNKAFGTNKERKRHGMCCKQRPDGQAIKPYQCKFCHRGFDSGACRKGHEKVCTKHSEAIII